MILHCLPAGKLRLDVIVVQQSTMHVTKERYTCTSNEYQPTSFQVVQGGGIGTSSILMYKEAMGTFVNMPKSQFMTKSQTLTTHPTIYTIMK